MPENLIKLFEMDRRNFILKSMAAGAVLAAGKSKVFAEMNKYAPSFDLVAVKGGEAEAMFDKAIEAMGGMRQFVKKNQTVVVKPNIGWDVAPEKAANTNPKLVARIIEHCLQAGAKDVYVFDHTCDNWNKCYSNSGIEKAAKEAGGKVVSGETEGYYQQVQVKGAKSLTSAKVHELILSSDVFINVPVLKHHSSSKLTVGMKNLMGIVWDRRFWHQNNLHQCIADFAGYRKPDLNIIDAYSVMKRNGPRGVSAADIVSMKSQIISTDIVAADTAAAKLFGVDPADIPYINMAHDMKIGTKELEKLSIKRISM